MFIDFLFELRKYGVMVSAHEWNDLMQALALGLHESSLDGFYRVARAICIKDLGKYDAFDLAFVSYFKDIEVSAAQVTEELLKWLNDPIAKRELTEEQRSLLKTLDIENLRKLFEERLKEQKERHDGGGRWIGTGGSSPFGHGGTNPSGIRIGGPGGGRSAMQIAEARQFREYRRDIVLDVRQIDVALRGLRRLGREGAKDELDIDETISRTGQNAGEIEVVWRPARRNKMKLILLMDVGGSMDVHTELVERLFTAASRTGRFSQFRHYYFHNCIYERLYEDAEFRKPVSVNDLLFSSSRNERLVVVGDALMHPAELLQSGGAIYYYDDNRKPGIEWIRKVTSHFRRSVWLNPEPERFWPGTTIEMIASLLPMETLSLEGLTSAVRLLTKS